MHGLRSQPVKAFDFGKQSGSLGLIVWRQEARSIQTQFERNLRVDTKQPLNAGPE
jgi:hypothetical protein